MGTKQGEYQRSVEMLQKITKAGYREIYFALAFLYDSQYSREDLGQMMRVIAKNHTKALTQGETSRLQHKHIPKTTVDYIRSLICHADPRSTEYGDLYGDSEPDEIPETGVNCCCDNCFYRRHALADELLACYLKLEV